MTGERAVTGVEIARLLALAGAETVVRAPKERLPFDADGPTAHQDRWRELGEMVRTYEADGDAAMTRMRDGLGLSSLDCWLVFACAAVERYPEAAAALGIMMDQPHAPIVTPMAFAQMMHAAAAVPVRDGLAAAVHGGAAGRAGLVEWSDAPGRPHSHQSLRLAAAELLRVLEAHDDRTPRVGAGVSYSPAFDDALVRLAVELLDESRMLLLRGASARAQRQLAVDVAGWLGLEPRLLPALDAPPSAARLHVADALPILDLTETASPSQWRAVLLDARGAVRRVLVLVRDDFADGGLTTMAVPRLTWHEARRVWTAATGDATLGAALATRFRVNAIEAAAAVGHARRTAPAAPGLTLDERIAAFVLEDGARRMGKLVTHIRSGAKLDDLVVPAALRAQLDDIVDWQRHSPQVFGPMGLGARTPLGRGLTCLFSGPPGTGKTFAAQCLANELGLNLYRIDLSQVVSKYIGETEKALSIVFDEAEAGHGVLLFDEADALFGKRSEVRDAHDRYANIEVGYLLQRLDAYDGMAILATNLRSNMDPAFVRRIRFMLEFPMPDTTMRHTLWEQSLPAVAYRDPELRLDPFAERFRLSGGSIQNISLAASHMAAATPAGQVRVDHLVRATFRELEKGGQSRDRASFGHLAEHLPKEVA